MLLRKLVFIIIQSTDAGRRERREKAKARGKELLAEGKTTEAIQILQTATQITHEIVLNLIKVG